jgi:RNA polymerase primary sigma factor
MTPSSETRSREPIPGDNRCAEIVEHLAAIAQAQGAVTLGDILAMWPEIEEYVEQLDEVLAALLDRGVELRFSEPVRVASCPYAPTDQELVDSVDLPADDFISVYLRDIGRVPLLSAGEEAALAKRMERGRAALRQLGLAANDPRRQQRLQKVIAEGAGARQHLIRANARLVVNVAKRYVGRGVPLLDLVQEGNIGLMRALRKFDHRLGHKFSTYATWWIRQAVTRAIADQSRTIRIPLHMYEQVGRLREASHALTQELRRDPTSKELAERMGVSEQRLQHVLRTAQLPLSLEAPIGEEDDSSLADLVEDSNAPSPADAVAANLLREAFAAILETLAPREARILALRFGLTDGHTYTLDEVGQKFGVTRERVRQIEARALGRLRHPSRSRRLREYLA